MAADHANPEGQGHGGASPPERIELPAPVAWPMVLALGVVLLAGGIITSPIYCILGGALIATGLVGWIGQLLPGRGMEREELRPSGERAQVVHEAEERVRHPETAKPRHPVPAFIHPYSAGLKGGALGGVAMAVLALLYGVFSEHGIWYPVNLLAGVVLPGIAERSVAQLQQFDPAALALGIVIHAIFSLGAGLLYGVLLPMMPRWPVLMGGVAAPLLWTGAVYGFMGVINPTLDEHVSWPWFIASQVAYGLVVGLWVRRTDKVPVKPRESRPGEAGQDVGGQASGQSEGLP